MPAKAKLASSITFIVLASFTIVTYDHQNMFIIQATGLKDFFRRKCFSFFGSGRQLRFFGEIASPTTKSSKQKNIQVQENEKRRELSIYLSIQMYMCVYMFMYIDIYIHTIIYMMSCKIFEHFALQRIQ